MRRTYVWIALASAAMGGGAPAFGQTSLGVGVVFPDLSPLGPGLQASAYVTLPALRSLRLGADFSYFRPAADSVAMHGEWFDYRIRRWELSPNLQYLFVRKPRVSVYGLTGVTIARSTGGSIATGDVAVTPTRSFVVDGNAGAGIELPLGIGALYGEGRYVIAPGRSRYTLGAGFRIRR